jgi:hypothetical protein
VTRGIDLEGFLSQIESVLSEWLRRASEPPSTISENAPRLRTSVPSSSGVRYRLGAAATTVYLEHLAAYGAARPRARLRQAWETLSRELFELESVGLQAALAGHAAAARELAYELGKRVNVIVDVDDAAAHPDAIEALGTAALHGIRNALDHGIGKPEQRELHGKVPEGVLRLAVRRRGDLLELDVEDDGMGIDFDAVRRKATRLGLTFGGDDEEALSALLFAPGFSTRDAVTEISGRGVGLDAVSVAVHRLGGRARIESARGRGTALRVVVPNRRTSLDAQVFRPPGSPVAFAVETSWGIHAAAIDSEPLDPLPRLGLTGVSLSTVGRALHLHLALRRGAHECTIVSELPPRPALVTRLCPTAPDALVEVVRVDGHDALLLRPDALIEGADFEAAHG